MRRRGRLLWPQNFRLSLLWLQRAIGCCSLAIAPIVASPALAAEKIYINYGLFEASLSVDSLEVFAREGTIQSDIDSYARYFTPEQLDDLQELLLNRVDLKAVTVAQFLYTEQGEILLQRLGDIIQTESRLSGFYAIRAALILAADDPEGLTPLNVLKKFPLTGIRINVARTLEVVGELEQLINQTQMAIATIERQSTLEAATEPLIDFSELPDLRARGSFTWNKQTILLNDRDRQRLFRADIYLPTNARQGAVSPPPPLIVISHGLGSDRSTYAYLAEHLASHGFAVAVPDHPGSDAAQLEALIEGRANQVTAPEEFFNRPLDIKFLLDDLERRSQQDPRFRARLNPRQVGIVGQSFGGYTALTLAGGQINFARLLVDCTDDSFNLSLLLQCRVQEVTDPTEDLQDDRIKAIIAINPIGSSLLGEEGFGQIQVPTMIISGDADTIAPSLLEQIYPFTWLNTPNKYLLLLRGATHFSMIGESSLDTQVSLPPELVGPDPALARRYLNALSVSFFGTYLEDQAAYTPYLGSAYARFICQPNLPCNLVRFLTSTQLAEAINLSEAKSP